MVMWVALLLVLCTIGCNVVPELQSPSSLPASDSSRTKFHTIDGSLYLMDEYEVVDGAIRGVGRVYDLDRALVRRGHLELPLTSIAVVETSSLEFRAEAVPMMLATAGMIAGAVACAANPKACFGSCPTFYVPDGERWRLQAEGFSTSVASTLEATDLDPLSNAVADDGFVTVAMRNEALETHFVRSLAVVTAQGPPGSTVALTHDGEFVATGVARSAAACAWEHDVCPTLAKADGNELLPESDPSDLAARTSIELRFAAPASTSVGLVVSARNSLMTTHVMYRIIALLGRSYGHFIERLEQGDGRLLASLGRFDLVLGDLDVSVRQEGGAWRRAGGIGYLGPIAKSRLVVPIELEHPDEPVHVRLDMARANWRIDAVGLAPILARDLRTTRSTPELVSVNGRARPRVQTWLEDGTEPLVTLPGDEVRLRFAVPSSENAAVGYFIESRGYYYEWMRREWLREEDVAAAYRFLDDPRAALREMAPGYKAVEARMDALFEASRVSVGGAP
jgi:hypothetical protein